MLKQLLTITALVAACCCLPDPAQAAWPERPVKFVLGSQAGSSIDMIGRQIAQKLSERFNQPFVASNITGGGLGAFPMTMKNARADGYTIGMGADVNFSFNSLDPSARFTTDDVEYICTVFVGDAAWVASPDRGWKDLRHALEWARDNDVTLNYMFNTPIDRYMLTFFAEEVGAKVNLIPSTGPSAILTSIMGGHTDIGYSGGLHYEQGRAGKIATLTMDLMQPSPNYPDVPLAKDLFESWYDKADANRMIVVPKGFPPEAKQLLVQALEEIINDPSFREVVEDQLHFVLRYMDSDTLTQLIQSQLEAHKTIMARANQ